MSRYEIRYDFDDEGYKEENIREEFEGSWSQLQRYIHEMKICGCYNISASAIEDGE